jgi:hypothetical protein
MLRRTCIFLIAIAVGCLPLTPAQAQNPCETALQSSAEVLDLSPSSPITIDGAVAEWESEIIKFRVSQTGLLSLGVEETGAEASLETDEGMVNQAPVEAGDTVLTPVVRSEVYCLRLNPESGTSLELQLQLTDICQLGPNVDDHGNSFACASEIAPGTSLAGVMTADDRDVFAFSLAAGGTVDVQGAAAVSGQLFDATGNLLASEEDRGSGLGFLISETLAAGRYFVRVNGTGGTQGAYTLSLELLP